MPDDGNKRNEHFNVDDWPKYEEIDLGPEEEAAADAAIEELVRRAEAKTRRGKKDRNNKF
jgi:hypothetical protein